MISIYYLYDPVNKVPFYVGATKDPKRRLMDHIYDTRQVLWERKDLKYRKVELIKKLGWATALIVIEEVEKEIAHEREAFHYHRLKSEGYEIYNGIKNWYKKQTNDKKETV